MEFAKIENHIITEIISTTQTPTGIGWRPIDIDCGMYVGLDIRMLDSDSNIRPVIDLVEEGYIKLAIAEKGDIYPEGTVMEKVKDNQIVPKTHYDFAKEGAIELAPLEYIDHDSESIKTGTVEELLKMGKITQEKAYEIKSQETRSERDSLLLDLDTVVTNPLRWDDICDLDKEKIKKYRKELLNIPQQEGFPWNVVFPKSPIN